MTPESIRLLGGLIVLGLVAVAGMALLTFLQNQANKAGRKVKRSVAIGDDIKKLKGNAAAALDLLLSAARLHDFFAGAGICIEKKNADGDTIIVTPRTAGKVIVLPGTGVARDFYRPEGMSLNQMDLKLSGAIFPDGVITAYFEAMEGKPNIARLVFVTEEWSSFEMKSEEFDTAE